MIGMTGSGIFMRIFHFRGLDGTEKAKHARFQQYLQTVKYLIHGMPCVSLPVWGG